MSKYIIGVDLGGTRIRAARLDSNLTILERHETLTLADEGLEPTLNRIKEQIRKVIPADASEVLGIGISAPGPLNPETGVIVSPPNLPGWHNVPLGDILREEFGVPVYTGNDANVAILAEAAVGAARGYKHAIYVTVSTGIGSGILTDSRLLLGKHGLGAEAGHMIMIVDDQVSSLEHQAAGPDMADIARARIRNGESSIITEMVNGDLDSIDGSTVGRAAQNGDALALSVVQRSGSILGMGIVNLLHLFNPEIVVIGGGVSKLGELLFAPMRESIEKYCIDEAYWRDLIITQPDTGEDVSIIGAAALAAMQGGKQSLSDVLNAE
jgi:glucokinase